MNSTPESQPEIANPPSRKWSGYFVAVEGIDGTGKSTLVRAVGEALERRGVKTCLSYEPTRGPYGRRIRELARGGREGVSVQEELDLFIADRREHLRDVILPALQRGEAVVLDRYYYSTMAYQGARAQIGEDWTQGSTSHERAPASGPKSRPPRSISPVEIERLHEGFAPRPDLLVLLELDVPAALERIERSRGDAPDHFEGREYLERVAAIFATIRHPHLLKLDARRPTTENSNAVLAEMESWLKSRAV